MRLLTRIAGGPRLPSGYRPLLSVSGPIAGIQLAQVALTTTDLVMMGLLGVEALAAGGLAITLYNQLRTMCVGMVTAVGNLVAGAAGRGAARSGDRRSGDRRPGDQRPGDQPFDDTARDEIRQVVRASFLVATVVGVLGGAVLLGLSYALTWFGQDSQVQVLARPVMAALAPGLLPMLWLNVLRQFAVGMRRPGSLLGVTVVSIAVNAMLNGAFVYGWLGLPVLGLAGIGLATTLVQVLSFAAFRIIVRRDLLLAPLLSMRGWKADLATVRTIVRLGTPICLTYGSEAGLTSVATLLMGSFGPTALAAHNVVNQLAYIVYQSNIGLSQGSSILVSRAVGQGRTAEASQTARRALTVSATLMGLVGVVYLVLPGPVLDLFLGGAADSAVLALAGTLLLFAIAHQFLKGAQNIGVGLLRGLGDTRTGFRVTLVGYWAVGTPGMLLCAFVLGMHEAGIWLGLCAGFGATALLLLRRFRQELHQHDGGALRVS